MANRFEGTNCGNCIFFRTDSNKPEGEGRCQHSPPVPIMVGIGKNIMGQEQPVIIAFWPGVVKDRWCGQHEPNEDQVKQ